jgi:FtsP/CotA-like multicopper oxidase with cupredoxin domain
MTPTQKIIGILALIAVALAGVVLFGVGGRVPAAQATEVVELKDGDIYDLTARYASKDIGGTTYRMLAYNGSIPGPTIRVAQGASVTIRFTNDTDKPALLHAHGVRMGNAFDGAQTSQQEIPPGGSFDYTLTFPDAGIYWYHPHAAEVYTQPLGLYGAFVVEPKDASYFPPVDREEVLFLSGLPIENGTIAITDDGKGRALMGHYGNVMLVNGSDDYVLRAVKEEVVRLYLVNAANTRPFRVAIPGTRMKLVGGDNGAYERATFVDNVTLGPSERAVVDVLLSTTTQIINDTPAGKTVLGRIVVDEAEVAPSRAAAFDAPWASAATSRDIDPFRRYFNVAPDKTLVLGVEMRMGGTDHGGGMMHAMPDGTMMDASGNTVSMHQSPDGIEWEDQGGMMNALTSDSVQWHITDAATGKRDMDIDWTFAKDTPVKIRIVNDAKSMHPMQHPIHFHGQRFLVVARDGVPQTNLVWKDTTLVRAGETVDIVLDPSNPGTWMAHCHIAEHLAAGMMFTFTVE